MSYMGKHIESLDFLKAFLVLTVLTEHYFGTSCFDNVGKHDFPMLFWFCEITNAFFRGQSVPVYFFISGYLFFLGGNFSFDKYFKKIKSRVKSLLFPYMIWNTIAVIMLVAVLSSTLTSMMKFGNHIDFSLLNLLSCYWIYDGHLAGVDIPSSNAPLNMPLWYIRDLIVMVVISPAIGWLLRKVGVIFLLIVFGLWIYTSIEIPFIYYPKEAMFFFSLGAFFSLKGKDIMLFSTCWFKFSLLIYILISILLTVGGYYEIKNIFLLKFLNIMVGLLLSISFASYISNGKLITGTKKYFGSAFFIYLSHGLINSKIIKIFILLINPDSDMGYITLLLLSYFSSILLLYSLYKALDRFAPRVLSACIGR